MPNVKWLLRNEWKKGQKEEAIKFNITENIWKIEAFSCICHWIMQWTEIKQNGRT